MKPHGDRLVSQVLIQWSSWPSSMDMWELVVELKKQFPAVLTWGQAGEGRMSGVLLGVLEKQRIAGGEKEGASPRAGCRRS